ncbi:MAG: cation:proton antiporter [Actinobacteria bacterium]|nr:MAG: cation:proton antiporter [Actinomycetota bacterium]
MNNLFLLIGIVVFLGLAGAKFVERIKTPQVVGYILIGVLLGSSFFNVIKLNRIGDLEIISSFALALIGFTIGGELSWRGLRTLGRSIITIAILESTGAFILVFAVVTLITSNLPLALVFGALASATAPATTVGVLWEYKSKGPLTSTLFAVVGLDDAIALILYGFAAGLVKVIILGGAQNDVSFGAAIAGSLYEIFGAILIGLVFGFLMHYSLKLIKKENEVLILTISAILVASGIALNLGLSLILSNLTLGVVLINISEKNKRSFRTIASITPPIFLLFFLLAGARLQISELPKLGFIGLAYIIMRVLGKTSGAYFGAVFSKAPETVRKYIGFGLLSQAGVAIGLAIEASRTFSALGPAGVKIGLTAINVIAATVFVFEIIGPIATRFAIFRAKEVPSQAGE